MLKQITIASVLAFAGMWPSGVSAGPVAVKPVFAKKTVVKPVLQPICLAFKVTPNEGRTVTTLKGGCSFAGATAVHFGAAAAAFTVQSDGSIIATPPALPAGSSVPVTVTIAGGFIVGGRAELYSYPIAEM